MIILIRQGKTPITVLFMFIKKTVLIQNVTLTISFIQDF